MTSILSSFPPILPPKAVQDEEVGRPVTSLFSVAWKAVGDVDVRWWHVGGHGGIIGGNGRKIVVISFQMELI